MLLFGVQHDLLPEDHLTPNMNTQVISLFFTVLIESKFVQ